MIATSPYLAFRLAGWAVTPGWTDPGVHPCRLGNPDARSTRPTKHSLHQPDLEALSSARIAKQILQAARKPSSIRPVNSLEIVHRPCSS